MAIQVIATVGGADSNSYVTLARANVLAEQLPHMEFWLTDTDVNKPQLLVHATRMIDRYFTPVGSKANTTQALYWPRKDVIDRSVGILLADNVIPSFVEMATVEWAAALHHNPDPYTDIMAGLDRLETPSYRMEFTGDPGRVIPRVVNTLLGPYSSNQPGPFHRVVRV